MVTTVKSEFRFTYAAGESIEDDLITMAQEAGLDETGPKNGYRKFKFNGETYYTLISEYTGQQRLSAGHIGCLTICFEGLEGSMPDGVEAVVTSTAIKLVPDEDEIGVSEFEYDGKPKLIQKLTVTI